MDIVDSHTHAISPDRDRYPVQPVGGRQSDWSQAHPVDHHQLIEAMDRAGVSQAVVVQASTVYGHDCRYLAEAVRAYPDRLVGVFSLDPRASDAVDQARRWLDEGLVGFRIFTTGTTMPGQADWLGSEETYPIWAFAEARDIPVCLQMTQAGVPMLQGVLERFPGLRVLLDHLARPNLSGGPPYADVPVFELSRFPGVHVKLTHRAMHAAEQGASTMPAFLARAMETFGPERVLWGSNFPAVAGDLGAQLDEVKVALASLPPAARAEILGGAARRLYPQLGTVRAHA